MKYLAYAQPVSYEGSSVLNPLRQKPSKNDIVEPEYTPEEMMYRNYLINRLSNAQQARDQKHAEFNGKTYKQYYEANEKIAHTYIDVPKNETVAPLATGTIEGKFHTLLAHLSNMNLTPEVQAFDRNNMTLIELGQGFTDVMAVVSEHDGGDDGGDKEKKMLRQNELLKQGTVFVQENWITKFEVKKKLNKKYNGEFKNFAGYTEKLEKVFEGCSRELMYGLNVYLGDITAFSMNDQPYVFTVEQMSYDMAETLYGKFENWKYVRPGCPDKLGIDTNTGARTIYDSKFRLTGISDTQVEVVKYQDQPHDEFMIMINGILMLPPGFPLSEVTPAGRYNITKQVLYVINAQFAYGKSFVSSGAVFELSRSLDNMLQLFDLKTRKSITPPYVNTTNRVIPARVLNPGNITMGIPANALQAIGQESQGVTSSEYQIFKELQDEIEKSTISNIFQGQSAKSGATATEIIEVQRQAKLTLGLIVAATTLLEVKCGYLRLWNILGKWMEPIGSYSDGSNRYRNVSRRTTIDKAGEGERRVIPIDGELPSPEAIRMLSLAEEGAFGFPVRRMYVSVKALNEAEIHWYVTVEAREDHSSSYFKLMFREMMGDAMSLIQVGAKINLEGITDEFGKVYGIDKSKVFGGGNEIPRIPPEASAEMGGATGNQAGVPQAPSNKQPQPKPKLTV
jgi:hypothetical protein